MTSMQRTAPTSLSWKAVATLLASFLVPFIPTTGRALDCFAADFGPPEMTKSLIRREFGRAVARIQCPIPGALQSTSSGTAYLIENTQGYLLTADHVISRCSGAISARTSDRPNRELLVEVVKRAPAEDLALIRLVSRAALQGVRPLDISERFRLDDKFYSAGFPAEQGSQAATVSFHEVQVKGMATRQELGGDVGCKQCILVEGDIFGGDSGSPLINQHGLVVATGLKRMTRTGVFTPMLNAADLLSAVELTSRVGIMDGDLRKGVLDEAMLIEMLIPSSRGCTNVELYSWVCKIALAPANYEKGKGYFNCPLVVALRDRELAETASRLGSIAPATVRGSTLLSASESLLALGDQSAAVEKLNQARAILVDAASQAALENPKSEELPYILMDLAKVMIKLFDAGEGSKVQLATAISASSEAAVELKDPKPKAVALSLLGDAALRAKKHATSAAAFATAREQGLEQSWVEENWQYAARKAVREGNLPKSALARGIDAAPTLSETQLERLAYTPPKP